MPTDAVNKAHVITGTVPTMGAILRARISKCCHHAADFEAGSPCAAHERGF
jgi:hypothetical protein